MRTSEEVGDSIKDIVKAMNSVSVKELDSILESISVDEAMGPILDPTTWQYGRYEAANQTRTVIQAIRQFKIEVSGIGNFHKVKE